MILQRVRTSCARRAREAQSPPPRAPNSLEGTISHERLGCDRKFPLQQIIKQPLARDRTIVVVLTLVSMSFTLVSSGLVPVGYQKNNVAAHRRVFVTLQRTRMKMKPYGVHLRVSAEDGSAEVVAAAKAEEASSM